MNWFKRKVAQWCLKHLFCAVTDDDILEVQNNSVVLFGEKLNREEIQSLSRFAQSLQDSRLWHALTQKIREKANKQMYEKSTSTEDLFFGKAMLYNLDVIEKFIERLASFRA